MSTTRAKAGAEQSPRNTAAAAAASSSAHEDSFQGGSSASGIPASVSVPGTSHGAGELEQHTLKKRCREGLSAVERRLIWIRLAGVERNDVVHYLHAARTVFGTASPLPAHLFKVPFLGVQKASVPEPALFLLQQPGIALSAAHDRVVSVLAQLEGLVYCPMLPNLALILLRHMNEAEAFIVLENLVQRAKTQTMFFLSRIEEDAFLYALLCNIRHRVSKVADHIDLLARKGEDVLGIFRSWIQSFFSGWLPLIDVFRVIDMYLSEGPKILVRLALAWLKFRKSEIRETTTAYEFEMALRNWIIGEGDSAERKPYRFSTLAEIGFNVRNLSMNDIDKPYSEYINGSFNPGRKGDLPTWSMASVADIGRAICRSSSGLHGRNTTHFPKIMFYPPFFVTADLTEVSVVSSTTDAGKDDPHKVFADYGFFAPSPPVPGVSHDSKQYLERYASWDMAASSTLHHFMNSVTQLAHMTYCAALSRHLSSLAALLPKNLSHCDWVPLYYSGRHGWSLDQLLSQTNGIAPIMLFLRLHPKAKLQTASRSGMVISILSNHGIPTTNLIQRVGRMSGAALDSKESSGTINRTSSEKQGRIVEKSMVHEAFNRFSTKTSPKHLAGGLYKAWEKTGPWVGAAEDFVCQVFPDCSIVRTESREVPDTDSDGPLKDEHILKEDKFLSVNTGEVPTLLIGGQEGTSTPLLEIRENLQTAYISGRLVDRMSWDVSGLMSPDEVNNDSAVEVQVTGIEAFGFCDKALRLFCSEELSARTTLKKVSDEEKAWTSWVKGDS